MIRATFNAILFVLGWVLYVVAQGQNSLRSNTNGLAGLAGWKQWLRLQSVNLATRAFFSGLGYEFILHTVTVKMQAVGLAVTSTMVAGVGGYSANALLYQLFGLLPWLRVEVAEFSPPPQACPTGPPGTH